MEWLNGLQDAILAIGESPWALVAVFALATIDGFFPVVPSESVVISMAVLIYSGTGPSLWWLLIVAAAGAFCGDVIAFHIGRVIPLRRLAPFKTAKGAALLAWAEHALERRGPLYIIAGRFIPGGRVAVNMTAGAIGFPRPRFMLVAAAAGVLWASYSIILGMAAGKFLHDRPLLAVAVGIVLGITVGFTIDKVMDLVNGRVESRVEGGTSRHPRLAEAVLRATAHEETERNDDAADQDSADRDDAGGRAGA